MKLLICSDIHGDFEAATAVLEAFKNEGCDRILMLGDILYHGPRNDLPLGYAPKKVIELLNANRDLLLSVRGNCDTEVDQMVSNFPILADYSLLELDGLSIFATHGHHHNTTTPPPLRRGEILLHGHTHVLTITPFGDENYYVNPGSVSIPKEQSPHSYMIIEGRTLLWKTLDGEAYRSETI